MNSGKQPVQDGDYLLLELIDSDRAGSPSRGRIEMECSRAGADRSRRAEGWRLTANQLKLDYPGDLGLDYMHELIENPTLWLSKKFQEV